jgi:type IV secretory pathway VirB6-like protein
MKFNTRPLICFFASLHIRNFGIFRMGLSFLLLRFIAVLRMIFLVVEEE